MPPWLAACFCKNPDWHAMQIQSYLIKIRKTHHQNDGSRSRAEGRGGGEQERSRSRSRSRSVVVATYYYHRFY